jgi:hypothetical protein
MLTAIARGEANSRRIQGIILYEADTATALEKKEAGQAITPPGCVRLKCTALITSSAARMTCNSRYASDVPQGNEAYAGRAVPLRH